MISLLFIISSVFVITSRSAQLSDVSYYLYTRNNLIFPDIITNGQVSELIGTHFDPAKPIIFVTHGWQDNSTGNLGSSVKNAALLRFDVNVFLVDWSGLANSTYGITRLEVTPVGNIQGDFVKSIMETYGLDGSSITFVGHSFGAHIAGIAGSTTGGQIGVIVGLDPALPLFSLLDTYNRLDADDGRFVQVIHTSGGKIGILDPIGDVDYYPNGGSTQPGCGLDVVASCAHIKAIDYYAESIIGRLNATQCSTYLRFQIGLCMFNPQARMGGLLSDVDTSVSGKYYLKIAADSLQGKN